MARACFCRPTYRDRFYAVLAARPKGAKRLVVLAPFYRRRDGEIQDLSISQQIRSRR